MLHNGQLNLYTIGFTGKSAEKFFGLLTAHNIRKVIDVRLNNTNQLAAYSKRNDLKFFLRTIGGIEYEHALQFAPEQEHFKAYKAKKIPWETYAEYYRGLLDKRFQQEKLQPDAFADSCLLCSEDKPHHCHRRLVAEYITNRSERQINVVHLI